MTSSSPNADQSVAIMNLIVQKCAPANCSPTNMIHPRHGTLTSLIPCPLMVPTLPTREIRLHPRILNRHTPPNPPLDHRTSVQPADLTAPHTESSCIRTLTPSFLLAYFVAVRV